jgi:hypothetical protein
LLRRPDALVSNIVIGGLCFFLLHFFVLLAGAASAMMAVGTCATAVGINMAAGGPEAAKGGGREGLETEMDDTMDEMLAAANPSVLNDAGVCCIMVGQLTLAAVIDDADPDVFETD